MSQNIDVPLYIHGELVSSGGEGSLPLLGPASGNEIGEIALASESQLQQALESSQSGFEVWSKTPAYDRYKILRSAAQLMRDRAKDLAQIMTLEQGKPLPEAEGEWLMCADIFDWAAEEGRRTYGRVIPSRALGVSTVVHKFPVGPVAAFAPWNFPALSPSQKIAPALAAGCSVILKPASDTPASSVEIAKLLTEAGLPAGVLNVVCGKSSMVSRVLIESPIIRKVSLTGSVEVGRTLAELSGRHLKKCTMELGGHAPVVVLRDADAAKVAAMAAAAKYRNGGQVCTSPTRFIVEEPVYDEFVANFVEVAASLQVGDGCDASTQMGPLASARQIQIMEQMVADARDSGAKISTGGEPLTQSGYYYKPTVIEYAPADAKVLNEEPFGPIAVMVKVKDVDEALAWANALPFGLAAYCFTNNSNHIDKISRELEAGMLAFNQFQAGVIEGPFGGVKDSGFGAEGGTEGIEGYMHTKLVSHKADVA